MTDFVVKRARSHESHTSYESDYAYITEDEEEDDDEDEGNDILEVGDSSEDYKVSNISSMGELVDSKGKEIATLLNVSFDAAIALLIKCKWSKENVLNDYYMCDGSNSRDNSSSIGKTSSMSGDENTHISCPICYEEVPVSEMPCLTCGHGCCLACWDGFLTSKVNDGPSCVIATCPTYKCENVIPYSFFQKYVDDPITEKYIQYVAKNFVENHLDIRYCPAADCDKVLIRQNGSVLSAITCECSQVFCFQCGEEAHNPINCTLLKDWNMKNASESLTASWIVANTKSCPKCKIRIEKNLGCMHMTCNQCRHEFCWTCLGDWRQHSCCNRLVDDKDESKKLDSKRELEIYIHYYERYINHDRALKIAKNSLKSISTQISKLRLQDAHELPRYTDLKEAVEVILECRRVLKHTYISGYYMGVEAQYKTLFEYQQEMLEKHTEDLHGYVERNNTYYEDTKMMNLKNTAKHFLKTIVEWFQSLSNTTPDTSSDGST